MDRFRAALIASWLDCSRSTTIFAKAILNAYLWPTTVSTFDAKLRPTAAFTLIAYSYLRSMGTVFTWIPCMHIGHTDCDRVHAHKFLSHHTRGTCFVGGCADKMFQGSVIEYLLHPIIFINNPTSGHACVAVRWLQGVQEAGHQPEAFRYQFDFPVHSWVFAPPTCTHGIEDCTRACRAQLHGIPNHYWVV